MCLPLPARRCIDGIWTMCISLMCSNYAHPPSILPACKAPPYIVAGGRKARPGTEVLKSRGGPAPGSDGPPLQRFFNLNQPPGRVFICFRQGFRARLSSFRHLFVSKHFPPHRALGGSDPRSRARMGSDVGVQTPVYHWGSETRNCFFGP